MNEFWWKDMNATNKVILLKNCGWRTNKGTLSSIGKRLLNQSWNTITPGTQNIILRNGDKNVKSIY